MAFPCHLRTQRTPRLSVLRYDIVAARKKTNSVRDAKMRTVTQQHMTADAENLVTDWTARVLPPISVTESRTKGGEEGKLTHVVGEHLEPGFGGIAESGLFFVHFFRSSTVHREI